MVRNLSFNVSSGFLHLWGPILDEYGMHSQIQPQKSPPFSKIMKIITLIPTLVQQVIYKLSDLFAVCHRRRRLQTHLSKRLKYVLWKRSFQ